jgi:hypothetical protein
VLRRHRGCNGAVEARCAGLSGFQRNMQVLLR